MRFPIHVDGPIELDGPFTLELIGDPSAPQDDGAVTEMQTTLERFCSLTRWSAFRQVLPGTFATPDLQALGRHMTITFRSFPYERQALRLLVRALQYPLQKVLFLQWVRICRGQRLQKSSPDVA